MEPTNQTSANLQINQTPVDSTSVPTTTQPISSGVSTSESNVITDQKSSGSNKMMFIAIFIAVVLVIVGGTYWLLTQTTTNTQQSKASSQEANNSLDLLKQELNSLNVEEITNQEDITALDQDLENLQN